MPEPAWQPCSNLEIAVQSVILISTMLFFYNKSIVQATEHCRDLDCLCVLVLTYAHYLPHLLHRLFPGNWPLLVVAIGLKLEQI